MPVWVLPAVIGFVVGFVAALVLNNNKKAVASKVSDIANKV